MIYSSEAYSEAFQTSKIKYFPKIVDGLILRRIGFYLNNYTCTGMCQYLHPASTNFIILNHFKL